MLVLLNGPTCSLCLMGLRARYDYWACVLALLLSFGFGPTCSCLGFVLLLLGLLPLLLGECATFDSALPSGFWL